MRTTFVPPQDVENPEDCWWPIEGVATDPEFTEEMLSEKYAGSWFELWWHWFATPWKWKSADPKDEAATRCCTGEVKEMGIAGDGDSPSS